jgi:hypothetical protein
MRKCDKCGHTLLVEGSLAEGFLFGKCPKCRWEGLLPRHEQKPKLEDSPGQTISAPKVFRAKVTGVENRESHHGGRFYHIFFKGNNGKSYLTHAYPKWNGKPVRNFDRWQKVIDKHRAGLEVILEDIMIKKGNIIDADSVFKYFKRGEA